MVDFRRAASFHPPTIHDTWIDSESEPELVSVIIPTYNRAHFLTDAVGSVFQQTYRPIEIIIVDDGSTDGTKEKVETLSNEIGKGQGLRLRYVRQENQGAPVARNRGLIESKGEFIQFLDSDDIIHPQKISLQANALSRHTGADTVWSARSRFTDASPPSMQKISRGVLDCLTIQTVRQPTDFSYPNGGLFRRKACYQTGPWEETLERYQDWEYAFRIAVLQLTTVRLDYPLYYTRDHDTGRIGDSRFGEEGVRCNLAALSAIDRVIESTPEERPELHEAAYRLYLGTLRRALKSGTDTQVRVSLQRAEKYAIQVPRQIRTKVIKLLHRFAGPKVARWALMTYSRTKTGSTLAADDPK